MGSQAHSRRIERWRVGCHRVRNVRSRPRFRLRRIGSRTCSFHRHLLAQAHTGSHPGNGSLAAMRRTVLRPRRHRPHGPHHRCCSKRSAVRTQTTRSVRLLHCAGTHREICAGSPSASSKTMASFPSVWRPAPRSNQLRQPCARPAFALNLSVHAPSNNSASSG